MTTNKRTTMGHKLAKKNGTGANSNTKKGDKKGSRKGDQKGNKKEDKKGKQEKKHVDRTLPEGKHSIRQQGGHM
jgi:hypothetical protein